MGNVNYSGRKQISRLERQETFSGDRNVHCLELLSIYTSAFMELDIVNSRHVVVCQSYLTKSILKGRF